MGSILTLVGAVVVFIGLANVIEFAKRVKSGLPSLVAAVHEFSSISQTVEELFDNRKLVVVPDDHWLINALYEATRLGHVKALEEDRGATPLLSTQERKTTYLSALLRDLKHEHIPTTEATKTLSKRVVLLASVFSELLPEYEPLLVEVALTHCLHEWTHQASTQASHDVDAFETFLLSQLRGDRAGTRFDCQLIIDTLDLMALAPHFYKQRITNQALRDLISRCIMENGDDSGDQEDALVSLLLARISVEENEAALLAWKAFLGEEIATFGYIRRSQVQSSSLAVLGDRVVNPTHFAPQKRAYFPMEMTHKGIGSNNFGDLSGILASKPTASEEDVVLRGFLYEGGALLQETERGVGDEENNSVDGYEVVDEPSSHPHTE